MKIVVITGSPHKNGTSALLADEFIRGAEEAAHEIFRFDAAFEKVEPCIGCDKCRKTDGTCFRNDSMKKLVPHLSGADAIVFVMPVYYFGIPTQMKAVIDRFYAPESTMMGNKKVILLATAYNPDQAVMDSLISQFGQIISYMKWEDAGKVLACGCGTREQIEDSKYPEETYKLGLNM